MNSCARSAGHCTFPALRSIASFTKTTTRSNEVESRLTVTKRSTKRSTKRKLYSSSGQGCGAARGTSAILRLIGRVKCCELIARIYGADLDRQLLRGFGVFLLGAPAHRSKEIRGC